ncbi:MAG: response regulator transcription factor [Campylobacterales bacterium]|nr:response regulator transcription factor [Campylobacterales bacterium]
MPKATLLVVEDDADLGALLQEYLEAQGYGVTLASTFDAAESLLFERRFDLLLLDVNLPDGNGFELLRSKRKEGLITPAIFVTTRGMVDDLERGFRSGGDDYLRKPFAMKELGLRVESILRRNYFHARTSLIEFSQGVAFDQESGSLHVNGVLKPLPDKEARLLKLLVQRRGELLSHEVIFDHLYDYEETPSEGALRTYIKNLRVYLGKDAIVSHKRLGYQLR